MSKVTKEQQQQVVEEETKTSPPTKKEGEKDETKTTTKTKTYREKPQLPSVAYLLQHGAEKDPNAPPETFLQSLVLPGLLLLTFVVSLALFHWATDGFKGGNHGQGIGGKRVNFQQRFAQQAVGGGSSSGSEF